MIKVSAAVCILLTLGSLAALAQQEPDGILIYQQPSTSFTEAIEYRTFRQDNALYSSLVTSNGTRKQLKSGGVVAVVPYPPAGFEPLFEETAATALSKIDALAAAHPQVRPQLQIVRGRWARALDTFRQVQHASASSSSSSPRRSHQKKQTLPPDARLTGATLDVATVTHASGVTTIPLAALTSAQILSLNATSRTFQLPLGTERAVVPPSAVSAPVSSATEHIERAGRNAIAFSSKTLGLADTTFSVWMFFVVLPTLILALLIAVVLLARSPKRALLPERRPISSSL